jgi:hypothetical protein
VEGHQAVGALHHARSAHTGTPKAAMASSVPLCVGGCAQPSHRAQAVGEEAQRLVRPSPGRAGGCAGRGVARVDEGLAALLALALVEALEVVAAHVDLAAHFQQRRCLAASRSGIWPMVRTFCVTSSPVSPSPRVAACTSTPCS